MSEQKPQRRRLRILTYLCPDLPVRIFSFIRNCVEDATGLEADLVVEDRFKGPTPDRANPFEDDLADIVFMHSTEYLHLRERNQEKMKLCPLAPVFQHRYAAGKPVYFSEIIIHSRNKEKYKTILDLKGCSWAYNDNNSLSGNLIVLNHLKKELKTNASHFGTIVQSGSHRNSIHMVRDARVEAASVDSTVLESYLCEHDAEHRDMFVSLASLGPLPIFPILFNTRLPDKIMIQIEEKLGSLHLEPKYKTHLSEAGLHSFVSVTPDLYLIEHGITQDVKGLSINVAYY